MTQYMMRRYLLILISAFAVLLIGCGGSSDKINTPRPASKCPHGPLYQPCGKHKFDFARKNVPPPGRYSVTPKASPTVEMQDTIELSTIVGHPYACAGYTSGYWPTYGPLVNSGRCGRVVSIAINNYHTAQCLDVEPGDADPSQAGAWIRAMQRAGVWRPCVYTSTSMMYSVIGNLNAYHIGRGEWREWCAHYTYYAHLEGDCDAVQWTDHAYGLNLDESTVKLSFFQGAKPTPPPGPSHTQIVKWVKGKRAARDQWNSHHCGNNAIRGNCPHFRRLVTAYQGELETKAKYSHVYCWGAFVQRGQAACVVVRPTYAAWLRAAASSRQQYWGNKCQQHPKRGTCHVWAQRTQYFNGHAKSLMQQNTTHWQ